MHFSKITGRLLLLGCLLTLPGLSAAVRSAEIATPPPVIKADPFYQKYLDCGGLPVLGSGRVADAALRKAAELIDHMLADRPDVRRALVAAEVRFVIIGAKEQTTDIPEYSHMRPKAYINERARGFGGRITSCGEENLLCLPIDRYDDENILIHEFAHVFHGYGLKRIDEQFDAKLRDLYKRAIAKGLWKNTYAGSNPGEYWAEAVQSYYDANRKNNWNHNHVSTREELRAYDPDLAKLVADAFRHTPSSDWRYRPVARQPQVTAPPESLGCDPYFTKYVWARGFPVLGSQQASDAALLEANHLIRHMFAYRHDVLRAMIDAGVRLVVIGDDEDIKAIPGYAGLDSKEYLQAADGDVLPGEGVQLPENLTLVCREGNLLLTGAIRRRGDPHAGESMLIRRFARGLYAVTGFRPVDQQFESKPKQQYELRVTRLDVRFDGELKRLYQQAMKKGLWRNTLAAANRAEYWAEGVQSWFDANRPTPKGQSTRPDGLHNHVDTREELRAYDPDLARLIAEVFRHTHRVDWRWGAGAAMDRQFEELGRRYVGESAALSPVSATMLGDHRFDGELNDLSAAARARKAAFYREFLQRLDGIDPARLSRANQVDHALLKHDLHERLWRQEVLQEWAWNPLVYTSLSGSAVYGLLAREFAPLGERLGHVADRLEQFPRLLRQVRATLDPKRVPKIHAETAVKQNRGVLSTLDNMVKPHLSDLPADERKRLEQAMDTAREAVGAHQTWLESQLLPKAKADFRLGRELFDRKLALSLQASLTRRQIRERAEKQLRDVRAQMYEISEKLYEKTYSQPRIPAEPPGAYRQATIRACLEIAYRQAPAADEIVETARRSLKLATDFVRRRDLVTIPPDPLDIIVMPEFKRGVSLAYCDSPGPLDVGQKTFYAVAPPPVDWTPQQVRSFLREYNVRSLHNLTIHEAMPGHFLQLAHSNRYDGKLRAVLSSGVFIEGWACYTELMMCDEGFLDDDPLMRLIVLKWYLRDATNAIIDQAVHVENMTRDEFMQLLTEDAFQEEREAAGKWVRAQLTSAQLSTYFVGYLEHVALRREVEQAWGEKFRLKTYHDKVLSFGSPPVKYVRALLLDREIPR